MKTAVPKRYERSRPDRTSDALATLGAGTIIDVRNGSPSLPCGSSSGSPNPRETGWHRTSPTPGDHRVSPATATLAGSHLRPPGTSIPLWCACLRPSLSSGAFRLLTAASAASTYGLSASGHMPLGVGGSRVGFDVSVDGFPEEGRQVSSPFRLWVTTVILEAATHRPVVVVVDGNHEYYDTADGGRTLDAAYGKHLDRRRAR